VIRMVKKIPYILNFPIDQRELVSIILIYCLDLAVYFNGLSN